MKLSIKPFAIGAAAALIALGTTAARPADSTERTTMPDYCSQRDVNCVLDDGRPVRVVVGASANTTPSATITGTGGTAGPTAGSATFGGSAGGTSSSTSSTASFRGRR